jgi:glucose-1-phosphate thymidylyltransferase
MILGDNIFYGQGLSEKLQETAKLKEGAVVFGYYVNDPERYGVAEFDEDMNVISLEEKPEQPKSSYAVTGLYFYPNSVVQIANKIKPSDRGELEITSVNEEFLNLNSLKVEIMGRGFAWLDTGTNESLSEAGEYVKAIQKRQGLMIACLEEIALEQGFITKIQAQKITDSLLKSEYGQYLKKRIENWK